MQPRFSSIALACAAVLSVMSMQVQADPSQSNVKLPSLTNDTSLASGMTTSAVRTYGTLQSALTSALTDVKRPESGNVGTNNGANNGANNGTNNGTNTGTNTGANNSGGNNGGGSNSGVNNPSAVNNSGPSTFAGTNPYSNPSGSGYGSPSMPGGNVGGETDWLKVIQVAAPVVATLSGNAKVGQIAGIVGSGAQVYGQVSSGQDLTASNYANIANIALQASAIGSKDPNLIRAAQIGNVTVGALNVYAAAKPNTASTAGGSMTQVGQMPSGQPVYRDASGANVVLAGVTPSGQPIYQSAMPTTTASNPAWSSNSRDRMQVSPGQMSADATAMARTNGIPDYSNGETGKSISSVWDSGSGPLPKPGSISPAQMASDKVMLDNANAKLDKLLAPASSSWNAGQISNEGAAAAAARGMPVDNSELQGSPSYAAYSQTINDNTTPADTVRKTYNSAARPATKPAAIESTTAAPSERVSKAPMVASNASSEWTSNDPIPSEYTNPVKPSAPTSSPAYAPVRGGPMVRVDSAAADKVAADKKSAAINSYLKNTPSVTDFMQ